MRAVGAEIGIDFVTDRYTLDPDPGLAGRVHYKALVKGVAGLSESAKGVYRMQPALTMPIDLYRHAVTLLREAIIETCSGS